MLCCQPMTMGLKMWPRNAGLGWDEGEQVIVLWNIMLIVGREDPSREHEGGKARTLKQSKREEHWYISLSPCFPTISTTVDEWSSWAGSESFWVSSKSILFIFTVRNGITKATEGTITLHCMERRQVDLAKYIRLQCVFFFPWMF